MTAYPKSGCWRKFGLLPLCGLSRLMLMQRNFPSRDNQISQPDAAAQHGFPKAAIEIVQIGRNPNRSYAAPVTDVSHAGRSCPSTSALLLGWIRFRRFLANL
jgi:hypothetical protein